MNNIIKEIMNILKSSGSKFTFNIWDNEIWFYIYETEIPIIVDTRNKYVYVNCETMEHHLTSDILKELSDIVNIIENNIDVLLEVIE